MTKFIGIARILQKEETFTIFKNIRRISIIVELRDTRLRPFVSELIIWGYLAETINYYKINDLILVKGYLAGNTQFRYVQYGKLQNITITKFVLQKIYPILFKPLF